MAHTFVQHKLLPSALLLVGVLASLALGAPTGASATSYTFTTIDVPNGIHPSPSGINNAGQIVGNVTDPDPPAPYPPYASTRGFLYTGGNFSMIDIPDSISLRSTAPVRINNTGQIVGSFVDATGQHGFLYTGGNFNTITVPSSFSTSAIGINDMSQVVGTFLGLINGVARFRGLVYTGGESFRTIDVPGSRNTFATSINNIGQIVGSFDTELVTLSRGFLYTEGTFSTIHVPGSNSTYAYDINDTGQIVGYFSDTTGWYGFLLSEGSFHHHRGPW